MRYFKLLQSSIITSFILMCGGCAIVEEAINNIKTPLIGESFNISIYTDKETLTMKGETVLVGKVRSRQTEKTSDGKIDYTYIDTNALEIDIDGKRVYEENNPILICDSTLNYNSDYADISSILEDSTKQNLVLLLNKSGESLGILEGDKIQVEKTNELGEMTHIIVDGKSCYIHNISYITIDRDIITKEN